MRPVFVLTVRQLAGTRRIWLVLALVSLPVLGALLYHVGDATHTPASYADDLIGGLVGSGILPLVTLLLGTSSFGNELDDRTLGYVVLRPLPRWKIVAAKVAAPFVVGGVPLALSGLLAAAIVQRDASAAFATGVGLLVGAAAYTAVFAWLGLASRHAIVVGLLYVFVWEASLAAYLDGVRILSIRRYTLGITRALDEHVLRTMDTPLAARPAALGAAVAVVGGSLLAVRKLSRMDIP